MVEGGALGDCMPNSRLGLTAYHCVGWMGHRAWASKVLPGWVVLHDAVLRGFTRRFFSTHMVRAFGISEIKNLGSRFETVYMNNYESSVVVDCVPGVSPAKLPSHYTKCYRLHGYTRAGWVDWLRVAIIRVIFLRYGGGLDDTSLGMVGLV